MILVALGANLPSERFGPADKTLDAALDSMADHGLKIVAKSRWYETEPVPPVPGQPWYVNGVAEVSTNLDPLQTLTLLHGIEASFGRVRRERWESRVLDLDLLAHGNVIFPEGGKIVLPHPRLHMRRFVLAPLVEIAADWQHPLLGQTARSLLAQLPDEERVRVMA